MTGIPSVDRIVYINLDHRQDRRQEIEAQFKEYGLEARRFSAIKAKPGGIGCSKSHVAILRQAKQDGIQRLLVFEDDFVLDCGGGQEILQRIFEAINEKLPQFDVVTFGYGCLQTDDAQFTPIPIDSKYRLQRCTRATQSPCYLVTGDYLERLADNIQESLELYEKNPEIHWLYSLDQYWQRLQKADNWFCVTPRIGSQAGGYSDISECSRDRSWYLN